MPNMKNVYRKKLKKPMVLNLVDKNEVRYLRLEIHPQAIITKEDIETVVDWCKEFLEEEVAQND